MSFNKFLSFKERYAVIISSYPSPATVSWTQTDKGEERASFAKSCFCTDSSSQAYSHKEETRIKQQELKHEEHTQDTAVDSVSP